MLELVCYLLAVVLFVLAALRVTTPVIDLGWLGLAFAFLPPLVHALQAAR